MVCLTIRINLVAFVHNFSSVDDIDLYIAGVSENHMAGAEVGPTFGCILAKNFQRVVYGDRFWFERPNQFTLGTIFDFCKIISHQ